MFCPQLLQRIKGRGGHSVLFADRHRWGSVAVSTGNAPGDLESGVGLAGKSGRLCWNYAVGLRENDGAGGIFCGTSP